MDTLKPCHEILNQQPKIAGVCRRSSDDHIVEVCGRAQTGHLSQSRPQTPFDAVADDGIADLLRHRKTKSRATLIGDSDQVVRLPLLAFKHKTRRG